MKPNGVSAVLCLGMQLRRSMMVLWPCHCNRCDWLPRNKYSDCFTVVKATDWYDGNTSDIHWGCLLLRLDYHAGGISLTFLWLNKILVLPWAIRLLGMWRLLFYRLAMYCKWLTTANVGNSLMHSAQCFDFCDQHGCCWQVTWLKTWDEWSECDDVYIDWAPVPSCSVILSDLPYTLCDVKRDHIVPRTKGHLNSACFTRWGYYQHKYMYCWQGPHRIF